MAESAASASPGAGATSPTSSTSTTLPSNPKLDRFKEERAALLSSNSHYELLQLYKTHIYRANTRKDPSLASLLALDGARTLLAAQQGNASGELALSLIDSYMKQHLSPSPPLLSSLLSLFWAFPSDARTSRVAFMKAAVKWSVGERTRKRGHPDLHLSFARFYAVPHPSPAGERDYASSHIHYLLAAGASPAAAAFGADVPLTYSPPAQRGVEGAEVNTYGEHACLLLEWAGKGFASERALFITRAVLQYLALADLRGAHAVLDGAMTRMRTEESEEVSRDPLIHFVQFVMRTCEREAGELFDVLRERYAPALQRDEGLQAVLDRIGEQFFGREAKKSWLDSLLG